MARPDFNKFRSGRTDCDTTSAKKQKIALPVATETSASWKKRRIHWNPKTLKVVTLMKKVMPGRLAESRKKFRRERTAEKKPNQKIITLTGWSKNYLLPLLQRQ